METGKAIAGRRSIRAYEDKAVPEETIAKILKAGAMAPSAMDAQPCRFIVITDKKKMRELSDKVKDKAGMIGAGAKLVEMMRIKGDVILYGAPLLILVVAEKGDWSETDCSLAAQNMMLQAHDLGVGSCFVGFARFLSDDQETLDGLGIKESQKLYCPIIFGYPKSWPQEKNREPKIQRRI